MVTKSKPTDDCDFPDNPNIKIQLGDYVTEAAYRQFSSGKFGYGSYGTIKINNQPFRLSLNIIEI